MRVASSDAFEQTFFSSHQEDHKGLGTEEIVKKAKGGLSRLQPF
jgi:hypothetical protein